jgi:thiamine-monophosphate kinase
MKLHELGEDRLLQRLTPHLRGHRSVVLGPGDDCALVRLGDSANLLVLKTDCIVEGVHFTNAAKPRAVGWKAMARPLSDFAAMSAVPQFALVTLIVPPSTSVRWADELYRGLQKAASAFDVAIVGGETSRTQGPASISISLSGTVEQRRWVARSGARPDDELFVTGRLGGSLGGRHLSFMPRIAESRWLTRYFEIHAMMDLSDGLGADLPRLAAASGVGFEIKVDALPRSRGCTVEQAISDGEDYELLFAVAADVAARLERRWRSKFPDLALTRIGRLTQRREGDEQPLPRGYVHFR